MSEVSVEDNHSFITAGSDSSSDFIYEQSDILEMMQTTDSVLKWLVARNKATLSIGQ